ncbi:MAG TPA: manganese efflux pump MntP family protein [Bacilli bacterium]
MEVILSIIFIGVGLSMDAFAVAVGKGLNMKKIDIKWSLIIASFFGSFQAIMPLLGWLLGGQFEKYIKNFDHWIVFMILLIIGGKAIYESRNKNCDSECDKKSYRELFILSIATSIDALAVGITIAILEIDILIASFIIGIVTFALSFLGVIIGNKFGCKYKSTAELLGGIILIIIGIKILIEHLTII